MKHANWFLYLGIIILLFGCRIGNSDDMQPVGTNTDTSTPSVSITQTGVSQIPIATIPQQTLTPLNPAVQLSPTSVNTILQQECVDFIDLLNLDHRLGIKIVLSGISFYQPTQVQQDTASNVEYLLDLSTGNKISFSTKSNQVLLKFSTSPSGSLLAKSYTKLDTLESLIDIFDSSGQLINSIAQDELWVDMEWINNQYLLVTKYSDIENQERGLAGDYVYFLLDPLSAEKVDLDYLLPGLFTDINLHSWEHFQLYNPQITKIVYPNMKSDNPVIVVDLESGKELGNYSFGDYPIWSPDGLKLAIVMDTDPSMNRDPYYQANDFYLISEEGQLTRLTYFTNYYKEIAIHNYSWSPDGKTIAFWMAVGSAPYHKDTLAILNIETGQVTDYCIYADPFTMSFIFDDITPIWSPDGNFVLLNINNSEDYTSQVYVIDRINHQSIFIGANLHAWGWMTTP